MRYVKLILASMPILCYFFIWGAISLPITWLAVASLVSASLGFVLGRYMSTLMARNLLQGYRNFLFRPVPGGIWFFIGLGILGGIGVAPVLLAFGPTQGLLILRVVAVVLCTLCFAVFGTLALAVLRLERTHAKHVYLGREGFYFDSA